MLLSPAKQILGEKKGKIIISKPRVINSSAFFLDLYVSECFACIYACLCTTWVLRALSNMQGVDEYIKQLVDEWL